MDDEMRRQMLLHDTMQKTLGYNDILNQTKQIADAARHAQAAGLYSLPVPQDFFTEQVRELRQSHLLFPGISHDIRQINQITNLDVIDLKARQEAARHWEQYQKHYTIPETLRMQQLATDAFNRDALQLSLSDTVAAMSRMHTPWLDARDPLGSVGSFASIHEIGFGVNRTPFQPEFTSTLRAQLGDWREVNEIPPAILEDPAERTEFYLERGFRTELVDFPPDALEEIIENAGLAAADDEENLAWRDRVSPYVGRIESGLRRYVNAVMNEAFGEEWTKRIHPDIVKRWRETKQKRIAEGRPELPHLIYYSDFSDLEQIMQPRDHFVYFKPKFQRVESMQEIFRRVLPARNAVAHVGIVTPIDYFTVMTEFARLRHVIDSEE
jgi:hypothetical protein